MPGRKARRDVKSRCAEHPAIHFRIHEKFFGPKSPKQLVSIPQIAFACWWYPRQRRMIAIWFRKFSQALCWWFASSTPKPDTVRLRFQFHSKMTFFLSSQIHNLIKIANFFMSNKANSFCCLLNLLIIPKHELPNEIHARLNFSHSFTRKLCRLEWFLSWETIFDYDECRNESFRPQFDQPDESLRMNN